MIIYKSPILPVAEIAAKSVVKKVAEVASSMGEAMGTTAPATNLLPSQTTKQQDGGTFDSVKNDARIAHFARLAAHVYGIQFSDVLPYGCKVIDSRYDPDTCMFADVYRLNSGETVCSFRGSQTAKDWEEDFKQAAGYSEQYNSALRYGELVCKRYAEDTIFVGHSQGGGEAAFCAFCLGKRAVTFNAAGLSRFMSMNIPQECIDKADVHAYIFANDVLNAAQSLTAAANLITPSPIISNLKADGHIHYVIDHDIQDGWHGIKGILRYFGIEA